MRYCYNCNRVTVGEYQVMITPLTEMKDTDPGKTPPMRVEKNVPDVPRKYRMPGSTPLTATIKPGDAMTIDLKGAVTLPSE